MSDPVNHPSHYTQFDAEVIAITRHLSFDRGNAVKYIARAGAKDPAKELEDLEKARWYLDDEIELVKRRQQPAAVTAEEQQWANAAVAGLGGPNDPLRRRS